MRASGCTLETATKVTGLPGHADFAAADLIRVEIAAMAFEMSMTRLLNTLAHFKSKPECRLPRLLVLSDDARGFPLARQHELWPHGVGFIERTYGTRPSPKRRHAPSLASCQPHEARKAGLDGVHWPQGRLRFRRRSACQGLVETASAHTGLEIAKARKAGISAILVSTAFPSQSPSAKRPLGACRLNKLARAFPDCTLYALGGVDAKTARSLARSRMYGAALVSLNVDRLP